MCSYHNRHTISLPLSKLAEARWTEDGKSLLQPHALKASCALLLARHLETQTTTFAVVEQPATPCIEDGLKAVASLPHLETWEISECPESLLTDAAKRTNEEPWTGKTIPNVLVIRWHNQPSASPASVSRSLPS